MNVQIPLGPNRAIEIHTTDRSHGDFAVASPGVEKRRQALLQAPWTWLNLVHGATVLHVGQPGEGAGSEADGAWTTSVDIALSVTTADCAPVVLGAASATGAAIAVIHAGWRGLEAGIVQAGAARLTEQVGEGAELVSFCGPCIGPDHYEFSEDDLKRLSLTLGPAVVATTTDGAPALDMFAGVTAALIRSGFPAPQRPDSTAGTQFFSHRVRVDPERMATVARMVSVPAIQQLAR